MISDWSVPFLLTSQLYSATLLDFNVPIAGLGTYLLRPDGCTLTNTVRAEKEPVPQSDGMIMHRRFVEGMEMTLAIQLWAGADTFACDAQAVEMTDTLMGYFLQLLNASDNEGRISWQPIGVGARMLDNLRLWTYPVQELVAGNAGIEIQVTLDTEYPYEEDLTELDPVIPGTVTNGGNRPTFPVYEVHGPFNTFILTDTTTGDVIAYNGSQPGASAVGGADYIEIDTFRNTMFLNGSGANMLPGLVRSNSDLVPLVPGAHVFTLSSTGGVATAFARVNAAWA